MVAAGHLLLCRLGHHLVSHRPEQSFRQRASVWLQSLHGHRHHGPEVVPAGRHPPHRRYQGNRRAGALPRKPSRKGEGSSWEDAGHTVRLQSSCAWFVCVHSTCAACVRACGCMCACMQCVCVCACMNGSLCEVGDIRAVFESLIHGKCHLLLLLVAALTRGRVGRTTLLSGWGHDRRVERLGLWRRQPVGRGGGRGGFGGMHFHWYSLLTRCIALGP